MYAGKAETVDVPERNVHILKNGYVYWTSSGHWDKEKNRTVDDRRSIGKLDPGNPAKMYPNKAYFTFYLVSEKDAEKQQLFRNDSSPDPGTAPSLTVFREPGRFFSGYYPDGKEHGHAVSPEEVFPGAAA